MYWFKPGRSEGGGIEGWLIWILAFIKQKKGIGNNGERVKNYYEGEGNVEGYLKRGGKFATFCFGLARVRFHELS